MTDQISGRFVRLCISFAVGIALIGIGPLPWNGVTLAVLALAAVFFVAGDRLSTKRHKRRKEREESWKKECRTPERVLEVLRSMHVAEEFGWFPVLAENLIRQNKSLDWRLTSVSAEIGRLRTEERAHFLGLLSSPHPWLAVESSTRMRLTENFLSSLVYPYWREKEEESE